MVQQRCYQSGIFVALLLNLLTSACAENIKTYNNGVQDWIEITRPIGKITSAPVVIWSSEANYSEYEWRVFKNKGITQAALLPKYPTMQDANLPSAIKLLADKKDVGYGYIFQQVNDGWLVAYNKGEFGAMLWWFSHHGSEESKISKHHINQFLDVNGVVYAIEGLAHEGFSHGSIITILKENDNWMTKTIVKTADSPRTFVRYGESGFVIAFFDSIAVYQKTNGIKILANNLWSGFYPNSIVLSANKSKAYVGMRQYVCEVDLKSGKTRYLIPDRSFLNKHSEEEINELQWQYGN
jgi:hypothetical protein